jgi:hypothetical protein
MLVICAGTNVCFFFYFNFFFILFVYLILSYSFAATDELFWPFLDKSRHFAPKIPMNGNLDHLANLICFHMVQQAKISLSVFHKLTPIEYVFFVQV